eukprot:Phypoly_transcript_19143.p1 GENE.Phypoly_transcript_19143~~Phypoly_transcript_19143.p1  ORF type:complete len:170 (+),score=7.31 Phypoly_transcript_19143:158-667(+)
MPSLFGPQNVRGLFGKVYKFINDPSLAKITIALQVIVSITLTILAGVNRSFTTFDSLGFYLVHFGIGVWGCACMIKKKKLGLVVYLVGLMIVLLLASVAFLLFSQDIDVLHNKCRAGAAGCDSNRLHHLFASRSRTAALVTVEAVSLHPMASYILHAFGKKGDTRVDVT